MSQRSSIGRVKVGFDSAKCSAAVLLVASVFMVGTASAAPRPLQTSFGSFAAGNPQALTVDQSNGDVYAIDGSTGTVSRFDASGAPKNFTAGPDAGTNTLGGTSPFSFLEPSGAEVAVDNSGGPDDGDIYVASTSGISIFSDEGAPLGTLDGSGTPSGAFGLPCGVAVDQSNGDLYVGDIAPAVWRYSPSGGTLTDSDFAGGISPEGITSCAVAADGGKVYASNWTSGPVDRVSASDFTTANPPPTVAGTQVDAAGNALATDPSTGDLYVDEGNRISVFDSAGNPQYSFGSASDFGTESAGIAVKGNGGRAYVADPTDGKIDVYGLLGAGPLLSVTRSGPGTGSVTSSPTGIDCGVNCQANFPFAASVTLTAVPDAGSGFSHWSGCDSATAASCTVTLTDDHEVTAVFSSKPSVGTPQSSQIAATEARLTANVNPEFEPTTYHFEYGTTTAYGNVTPELSAGNGGSDRSFTTLIEGLSPATTYHWRIVATNPLGSASSADQTFTTYASASIFGPCPNDALRTGPGASLPDCRAYEQATAIDKNGSDAQGSKMSVAASPDGDAITFTSQSGVPGGVGAATFPAFATHRAGDGWSTEGLLPPQELGQESEVVGWTPDLRYSFSVTRPGFGADTFLRQSQDHQIDVIVPGSTGRGTYAYVGASSDDSKVYFEAKGVTLTPDAAPVQGNLYVWNAETHQIKLVGQPPAGASALKGSFAGSYDWWNRDLYYGGALGSLYTEPTHAVSEDGNRVFFTAVGSGQLYLRTDPAGPNPSTVHVSASQRTDCADHDPCSHTPEPDPLGAAPAAFQTATADGSAAFFTSSEELTDDANTGPPVAEVPAIARADVDGSASDLKFLPTNARDVAVDGSHIYWSNPDDGTIGRANLDGTGVDPAFIRGAGAPNFIAVDSSHIYWSNRSSDAEYSTVEPTGTGSLGRANLDGSDVQPNCITGVTNPTGIAVGVGGDSDHLYWGNAQLFTGFGSVHQIGRTDISGDCASANSAANPGFIELSDTNDRPAGLAVDANSIYWASNPPNNGGGPIERANIDGTGPQTPIIETDIPGETGVESLAANTDIAVDGTYLYWTDIANHTIERAHLDGSDGQNPTAIVPNAGVALGLTLQSGKLYWATNQQTGAGGNPGNDLYRYDSGSRNLKDLTPDSSETDGADVLGVLGASNDGSYIYFAANGVLAAGASPGDCADLLEGHKGICNLYLWHRGEITFISRLQSGGALTTSDAQNWFPKSLYPDYQLQKTSRVTPDGKTLLFRSVLPLTSAVTPCESLEPGADCPEFFRYRADTGELTCVTCNPTGAPTTGSTKLASQGIRVFSPAKIEAVMSRNLSADGNTVFFESQDALVERDTNGAGGCPHPGGGNGTFDTNDCQDVYEWEAVGSGSCKAVEADGGCLYLLSSGKGKDPAFFGDASVSGNDAFIFTSAQEVPSDQDQLYDIYDVRVNGGLAAQHQGLPQPCTGDACQGNPTPPPADISPGSSRFIGPGNQVKKCAGSTRSHKVRCKKHRKHHGGHKKKHTAQCKKHKKECKKHSKSTPRTNTTRGGSK
jgi:hypothetical protein